MRGQREEKKKRKRRRKMMNKTKNTRGKRMN